MRMTTQSTPLADLVGVGHRFLRINSLIRYNSRIPKPRAWPPPAIPTHPEPALLLPSWRAGTSCAGPGGSPCETVVRILEG